MPGYDFTNCNLCPRLCGADRRAAAGFCGCSDSLNAARAGLHYYEEPFLSGDKGSGTVFFSGCNLKCEYCQNYPISLKDFYQKEISVSRLGQVFLELQEKGAHNINLVTGTPYIPLIADAIKSVKDRLDIPVVWNSSGYENVESLTMLEGLVEIWLPDFKTLSPELGARYMNAPDYPDVAKKALSWMVSSAGRAEFRFFLDNGEDISESGLMVKGVCVRHLVIPGRTGDSKNVLKYLYETFGNEIWISLMSQYTPMHENFAHEELNRKLSESEYDEVVDYAIDIGIEQCMIQEGDTAEESFIPEFDGTGL